MTPDPTAVKAPGWRRIRELDLRVNHRGGSVSLATRRYAVLRSQRALLRRRSQIGQSVPGTIVRRVDSR
jgi:hypothetical protein